MITAKRGDSQPPQFVLFQGYTTPTARTTSTTFTVLLLYVQANKSLHNRVVHRALETLQHVSKTLCQSDLYCIGVSYRSEEHARLSGPPHHRDTLEEGTIFSLPNYTNKGLILYVLIICNIEHNGIHCVPCHSYVSVCTIWKPYYDVQQCRCLQKSTRVYVRETYWVTIIHLSHSNLTFVSGCLHYMERTT